MIGSSIRECRGPGIVVAPNSTARIVRNWIVDNGKNVGDAGPGIELGAGARAIVLDNVITGNAAEGIRAAPESLDSSILRANLFEVPGRKRNARGPSTATR